MASHDEAAVTTVSKDGAGVVVATHNDIAATTALEMDQDQSPPDDDENHPLDPLLFQGQIDGNADTAWWLYREEPDTLHHAQTQGIARLKEMLNDPNGEIAHHIKSTTRWLARPLSSNDRCRRVQHCLTGKNGADVTDESVPFILATWCMLAGSIPSMWRERLEGKKAGAEQPFSERGKKMLLELEQLGRDYEFDFCKNYAKKFDRKKIDFNVAEAMEGLMKPDNFVKQTKTNSKRAAKSSSLGKHGESSPRQSPAPKRLKAVAPRQSGGYHARDDDDEDASLPSQNKWALSSAHLNPGPDNSLGNRAGTGLYGPGLKKSKMSPTQKLTGRKSQWRNGGYSVGNPSVTVDVPSSPYRKPPASSGQPPCSVPSEPRQDSTAAFGVSPPSERGSTLSAAQLSFAPFSSFQRSENVGITDKTLSSLQSRFTTINLGHPDSLYEAVGYRDEADSGISGAQTGNSGHDSRHSTAQSKEPSAAVKPNEVWRKLREQGKQLKATIKKLESRAQLPTHRDEGLPEDEDELDNLGGQAKRPNQRLKEGERNTDVRADDSIRGAIVNRSNRDPEVEIDKLKAEIQKINEEKETQLIEMMGVRRELQIEQEARGRAYDAGLKKDGIIQEYTVKLNRMMSVSNQNDHLKDRISKLDKDLDASREKVEASKIKIAALKEAAQTREVVIDDRAKLTRKNAELQEALDLAQKIAANYKIVLDDITAEAILQATTATAKDKGLAKISLAEILDGMLQENDDGSGTSGPKDSEDHRGHDDGADEEAPPGPKKKAVEVAMASAGLGEHEGHDDGEGWGEIRAGHTGFSPVHISSDSDSDSDSGGH